MAMILCPDAETDVIKLPPPEDRPLTIPTSKTVEQILSDLNAVDRAEYFAMFLNQNGYEGITKGDAAGMMAQLWRFWKETGAVEGFVTGVEG